jgi:hypothetical protein
VLGLNAVKSIKNHHENEPAPEAVSLKNDGKITPGSGRESSREIR